MQYKLLEDKVTVFRKLLATKNTIVKLISLHGEVAIVETDKGDRFSVHITSIEKISKK